MESISPLQYLSRDQLENLVTRLQLEMASLKCHLVGAEERNHLLQFALPETVRECIRNAIDTYRPLLSTTSIATLTDPVQAPPVVAVSSVATQTDSECDPTSRRRCVHTQTESVSPSTPEPVSSQAAPSSLAVETNGLVKSNESVIPEHHSPDSPRSDMLQHVHLTRSKRRKRKHTPGRMTEDLFSQIFPLEKEVPGFPDAGTASSTPLISVVKQIDSNQAPPIKPLQLDLQTNHAAVLNGKLDQGLNCHGVTKERDADSSTDDCILLDLTEPIPHSTEPHAPPTPQPEYQPQTSELPAAAAAAVEQQSLDSSTSALSPPVSGPLDDPINRISWSEFSRVEHEVLADPQITMSRHWSLFKSANEWTRATCLLMAALFDPDEIANSTVLGRSGSEPRERLPVEKVNYIVATICQQFGVPPAKVRARMAQKCKDERRKRRLHGTQNSLDGAVCT